MTEILYEDFSLWIEPRRSGSGYRVNARCRAGEDSALFDLPGEIGEIPRTLTQLASMTSGREASPFSPPRDLAGASPSASHQPPLKAWQIGGFLFRALFSGGVRQLYDRVCGSSTEPNRGVRIKLHFDPDNGAGLYDLPWELLYASETKDYLGLNRLSPIVRYLELPRPSEAALFSPPLRVLLAAANPSGSHPLDLDAEGRLIRQSLASSEVEVAVLAHSHLEALRESLLRGSYHVLHFMGHGTFDARTGIGSLLLESAAGHQETASGEVLANHLKGCLPQLVVVNACHSGRAATDHGHDFYAGIASSLVMAGVPAVVAMRAPVTDRAAIAFSKALYREVAAGAPVDAAVAEGRLAIYRADPFSLEWAIPVLFMRVPDGRLFKSATEQEAVPPPSGRSLENEDMIRIGGDVQGGILDIGIQRGSDSSGASRSSLQIDGSVTGDNVTIVNRKSV
ncbi:MAG TPA: CHAT domain-containing protein [Thermoanaerobaculia bacterium]|jgi:hypothetical protein|nr:CHAT domain-containing protein [Thermoanaerobaculia bacterium]